MILILLFAAESSQAALEYKKYLELECDSFGDCIKVIIDFVSTKIVPPLAVLFLMLAGFKFVTSQGNETKLKEAKDQVTWTVAGIAIAIGALALAYAFGNFLVGIS